MQRTISSSQSNWDSNVSQHKQQWINNTTNEIDPWIWNVVTSQNVWPESSVSINPNQTWSSTWTPVQQNFSLYKENSKQQQPQQPQQQQQQQQQPQQQIKRKSQSINKISSNEYFPVSSQQAWEYVVPVVAKKQQQQQPPPPPPLPPQQQQQTIVVNPTSSSVQSGPIHLPASEFVNIKTTENAWVPRTTSQADLLQQELLSSAENLSKRNLDIEEELTQQSLYKTELCRSWQETGICRYGTKCQFAHGKEEVRPVMRHPKYKTEICKTFHTLGNCPYGTRCRFIHNVQLRNQSLQLQQEQQQQQQQQQEQEQQQQEQQQEQQFTFVQSPQNWKSTQTNQPQASVIWNTPLILPKLTNNTSTVDLESMVNNLSLYSSPPPLPTIPADFEIIPRLPVFQTLSK